MEADVRWDEHMSLSIKNKIANVYINSDRFLHFYS